MNSLNQAEEISDLKVGMDEIFEPKKIDKDIQITIMV